jgi:hypothetical protein
MSKTNKYDSILNSEQALLNELEKATSVISYKVLFFLFVRIFIIFLTRFYYRITSDEETRERDTSSCQPN